MEPRLTDLGLLGLVLLAGGCCPKPPACSPCPERILDEFARPDGATPEQALEEFLQAIDAGDCEALLRCAPPDVRARHPLERLQNGCIHQLESLRRIAVSLRKAREGLVVLGRNRAALPYAEHRKLTLIKRDERWYVEDL